MGLLAFLFRRRKTPEEAAPKRLWQVQLDGEPFGHLCKDYIEFRDLIAGASKRGEIPQSAVVSVCQRRGWYVAPKPTATSKGKGKGAKQQMTVGDVFSDLWSGPPRRKPKRRRR